MKKTIIFVFMVVFALSSATTFANKADTKLVTDEMSVRSVAENNLTEAEIDHLKMRVEEIRDMDKSDLTLEERHELRRELKEIRENARRGSSTIYIGTGTLLLIIILILLLT